METTTIFRCWGSLLQSLWSTGPVRWRQTRQPGKVSKITASIWPKTICKDIFLLWCTCTETDCLSVAMKDWGKFILSDFPCRRPALVLLTRSGTSRGGYEGRISVAKHHVTLDTVTGADEGSYTVRDDSGVIQRKVCLNVKGESTNDNRYFLFSHAWPVLNDQYLPSGCCCFLSSYYAPPPPSTAIMGFWRPKC